MKPATIYGACIGLAIFAGHIAFDKPAQAQGGNQLQFVPLGYQQLTSLSAATALTVPARATRVVITCEAQAVRYRDDGTAPTASVGMPLAVGVSLTYDATISAIQIIEQTSGAKCNMLYYR